MHHITKFLYHSKKNYYPSQNVEMIVSILLGIIAVWTIVFSKSRLVHCIVACLLVFASMIYFNLQSYHILRRVKQNRFVLVSEASKRQFMILERYGMPLLHVFLMVPVGALALYMQGVIDRNALQIALLAVLIMTTVIKAYVIDFIILFSPDAFCCGNVRYQYTLITKLHVFQERTFSSDDRILYFELYHGDQYLGFDKFYECDYDYLQSMVRQAQKGVDEIVSGMEKES